MRNTLARQLTEIRQPTVAGRFYPDRPDELRSTIAGFLDHAKPPATQAPKAIIAPHAGYIFSGPVAASAHIQLMPDRNIIKRIVLIGPSHFVAFDGLAATSAKFFETPLGRVPVDTEAIDQLLSLQQVTIVDEAHCREHSLEVHLPFLQVILGDFKIVPLVTGKAAERDVNKVIATLWDGPETRFVISSDLSHYHEYAQAQELDFATSRAIERLEPEDIMAAQACGRVPVCALLRSARQHGLHARTVDLRNSGDTAGPHHDVVGYGAFAFQENLQQN